MKEGMKKKEKQIADKKSKALVNFKENAAKEHQPRMPTSPLTIE